VRFPTAKENLIKTLTFLKPADDRLTAEQPRAILKCLEAKFGPGVAVTFEDLGAVLKDEPTFVSKQDPALVVAYYAKRLADAGYVKYEIVMEETPDETDLVEIPPAPPDIFTDGEETKPLVLPEVPGDVEMDPIDAPAEFKGAAKTEPKAGARTKSTKTKSKA
jgi:hypothetical protein